MWEKSRKTVIILSLTPPVVFRFTTMSGFRLLSRMPTASSSISRSFLCSTDFVASNIMMIKSAVFATVKMTPSVDSFDGKRNQLTRYYLTATPATWPNRSVIRYIDVQYYPPWLAPSTIPGKSRSCILAPEYSMTPGIAWHIVNAIIPLIKLVKAGP